MISGNNFEGWGLWLEKTTWRTSLPQALPLPSWFSGLVSGSSMFWQSFTGKNNSPFGCLAGYMIYTCLVAISVGYLLIGIMSIFDNLLMAAILRLDYKELMTCLEIFQISQKSEMKFVDWTGPTFFPEIPACFQKSQPKGRFRTQKICHINFWIDSDPPPHLECFQIII